MASVTCGPRGPAGPRAPSHVTAASWTGSGSAWDSTGLSWSDWTGHVAQETIKNSKYATFKMQVSKFDSYINTNIRFKEKSKFKGQLHRVLNALSSLSDDMKLSNE